MKPPRHTSSITAADLPALRALLAVDRPVHWELARAMLRALERALKSPTSAAGPAPSSSGAGGAERDGRDNATSPVDGRPSLQSGMAEMPEKR